MGKRVWLWVLWLSCCFIIPGLQGGAHAEAQEAVAQIIVNIPSRTLELYKENTLVKEFPIAIGKPSTPTPTGEFSIIEKEVNPAWYPPGKDYVVPSGPSNPLGYRWMGIGSLYGIHGTNAPWSIGLAVSNGCIRMQEEAVEELFELVDANTPVKIEYERIKVRIDNKGRASIGIYPDVYGRQRVAVTDVKAALAQANLGDLVDDEFLETLIEAVPDRQIVFAQLHNLKINGKMRSERVISSEGIMYIPVMALADSLHTTVTWNEANKTITRQNQTAPGFKRGNTIYVSVEYLPVLFGGREVWNDSQNCLELVLPVANFEGQLMSGDIQRIGDSLAVPALTLAQALGERVTWRPYTAQLLVRGRQAPIRMIGGQPFVTIQDIGEVYNTAAVWDDKTQSLELSYPLYTIDYSMYIDPNDEYL